MIMIIINCLIYFAILGKEESLRPCVSLIANRVKGVEFRASMQNNCSEIINYKISLEALLPGQNKWLEVKENIANEKQMHYAFSSPFLPLNGNNKIEIKFLLLDNKKVVTNHYKYRLKGQIIDSKLSKYYLYSKVFNLN